MLAFGGGRLLGAVRFFFAVDRVVELVGVELRLTREKASHSERFAPRGTDSVRPGLLFRGSGNSLKMMVMELLVGLFLSKVFYLPTGEAAGLKTS